MYSEYLPLFAHFFLNCSPNMLGNAECGFCRSGARLRACKSHVCLHWKLIGGIKTSSIDLGDKYRPINVPE